MAATIAAEDRTGTKLPELTACHFNVCLFGEMLEGNLSEWVGYSADEIVPNSKLRHARCNKALG